MTEDQAEYLEGLHNEVKTLMASVTLDEGEHLWDNYQKVTAYLLRLTEIHNDIAALEIVGEDWPEVKKFRTLVVDPTIDRFEKVAIFESRKITSKGIEFEMQK